MTFFSFVHQQWVRLKTVINFVAPLLARMGTCTDWDRELLTQMSEVYALSGDGTKALNDVTYDVFAADEGEEYAWLWIDFEASINVGGVLVTTDPS